MLEKYGAPPLSDGDDNAPHPRQRKREKAYRGNSSFDHALILYASRVAVFGAA